MSNATASYSDDSVEVSFSASMAPDWDGSGRPLVDISGVEIESLTILGVKISPVAFDKFPLDLQEAVYALAEECEFTGDFEDDGDYAYEQSRDE